MYKALWIDENTHRKLKNIAYKQKRELKELVAEIIEKYLNEKIH
jgi:predicted HicB family RNase H-like nuclease